MSLKGFHIFFIVLASLCSLGFAAWTFLAPQNVLTGPILVSGWTSAFAGVTLAVYGVWFVVKKSRKIIV